MTINSSSALPKLSTASSHLTATWAAFALVIAILGISTASILITYAQQELGSNAITFNRLGLAGIVFAFCQVRANLQSRYSSIPQLPVSVQFGDIGLLILAGVSFASSLSVWAWSMTQTSIANATLLENVLPLFTTLGGWLFLRQRFSRQFLMGMIVAIGGAIAIGLADLQISDNQVIGDSVAVLSAVFASATLLSIEKLREKFTTIWIMTWTCLIGAAFACLLMVCTESQWFPHSSTGIIAIISLALVSQCIGQGLLTFCLTSFTSAFVAVTLLSIPAIAATFAWILFEETLSFSNIIYFVVVLVGIYLAITAKIVDSE
ncbi:MAG: DMT family transporter [Microcystaceae cyanobacterium]